MLAVPERLLMTVHSALRSQPTELRQLSDVMCVGDIGGCVVGPLFVDSGELSSEDVLCLHLLRERIKGEASFFKPYIDSIPPYFPTM